VAYIGGGLNRHAHRESSPGFRFTLYAVVCLVLLYYDQRDSWLTEVRYVMQAAAYPIQAAVSFPKKAWLWGTDLLETRDALRADNQRLLERERELAIASARFAALEKENARLRALNEALPPLVRRTLVAEVISDELTPLRQRLLVNQGARNGGVFRSQPVVDARGLVGQVARIGPWSAEIILITDPEHALPIEVVRNGLRSIAVGSGDSGELLLPYLAVNSDVKPGDILVSSGLGGVFPAGYPVAEVTGIKRDPELLLAQVRARPLATLARDRQVMLLWFDPGHPAAPVQPDPELAKPGEIPLPELPARTAPATQRPATVPAPAPAPAPTPTPTPAGSQP
jgi:rod shape-determining protein MreC